MDLSESELQAEQEVAHRVMGVQKINSYIADERKRLQ